MARRASSKWSKELHLHEGMLGPVKGRTAKQIVAEGLRRAHDAGDADPRAAVRKRIQVLVNLSHPDSPTLKKALAELDGKKVKENPTRARRSLAGELPGFAELSRLATVTGNLEGKIEGAKKRGELSDADYQLVIGRFRQAKRATYSPTTAAHFEQAHKELAQVEELLASKVAGSSKRGHTRRTTTTSESTPMATRKVPNTPGTRLARAIMKATKGIIPKGTSRKQRGAIVKKANAALQPKISGNSIPDADAIKAALRSAVSSVGAKPSGKAPAKKPAKKAAKKKAPKKPAKKAAKKKAPKKPAKKAAKKKAPKKAAKKAAKKKANSKKPKRDTKQRAAAVEGRARGKRGRGGVTTGGRRTAATPSVKQRNVAATFGIKGQHAFSTSLANLTGEGVEVGRVTRIVYSTPARPGNLYGHNFKKSQRPCLYMDVNAYNSIARATEQPTVKKANRTMKPMHGRWVEIGEADSIQVKVGNQVREIQFGVGWSAPRPRVLANQENDALALTWYGGAMKRARAGERVMFVQTVRGSVVSSRGIVS